MTDSNTFLICHGNEIYRNLIREMLSKLGFYHIIETDNSSIENLEKIIAAEKDIFILIESNQLHFSNSKIIAKKKFLILENAAKKNTFQLSSQFGLKKILIFPFTSRDLGEMIEKNIQ